MVADGLLSKAGEIVATYTLPTPKKLRLQSHVEVPAVELELVVTPDLGPIPMKPLVFPATTCNRLTVSPF